VRLDGFEPSANAVPRTMPFLPPARQPEDSREMEPARLVLSTRPAWLPRTTTANANAKEAGRIWWTFWGIRCIHGSTTHIIACTENSQCRHNNERPASRLHDAALLLAGASRHPVLRPVVPVNAVARGTHRPGPAIRTPHTEALLASPQQHPPSPTRRIQDIFVSGPTTA